jgi:hypothetical protein
MKNSSETAHTEKNLESKGISHPKIGDLQHGKFSCIQYD